LRSINKRFHNLCMSQNFLKQFDSLSSSSSFLLSSLRLVSSLECSQLVGAELSLKYRVICLSRQAECSLKFVKLGPVRLFRVCFVVVHFLFLGSSGSSLLFTTGGSNIEGPV
jgi:hypothetical protein